MAKKKVVVFQLTSENLTHLGGQMGSEYTTTNFTKPFSDLVTAKQYAEKDYRRQAGKNGRPIVWVRENSNYVRTEDMSFVMYHIRKTAVA